MRWRLFFAFAILILITLIGVSLFIRQSTADQIRQFVKRGGALGINAMVDELEAFYESNQSWDGVDAILGRNNSGGSGGGFGRGEQGRESYRITDANGVVVYDPDGSTTGQSVSDDQIKQGIELAIRKEIIGYLLLPGGESTAAGNMEQALLSHLDEALGNAALLSGLAALILALLLAGVFVKPIGQLTRAASSLAKGNLDERVSVKGTEEVKTLARTFNQMAEALQHAEHNRKAMTADIAHELRTPLAVQKVNLEALQDGVYALTVDNLQPILDQNELMTHLVQDLRILSLAEAGELALEKSAIELTPLLQRMMVQFQQQAEQRGIQLIVEENKLSVSAYADRTRVAQIISNLLQNALRYTPEGSQVFLSANDEGQMVSIHIRDTGAGIPVEALPYVFERFYKADKSRSRGEMGSGLGLAIARQLAELNGGKLSAANCADGGAVFSLFLPKAI